MKNNKGITLASLAIMIIILLILSSVAIYTGSTTIRYAKYNKAKSEMELMQTNVNSWYQEYKNGNTEVLNYGVPTSDSTCDQTALSKTVAGANITDISIYKFFSENYIKNDLGIDGISFDFLINIENRKVILFNGIEYNKEMYYTIEDFGISNVESVAITSVDFSLSYDEGVNNSSNIFLHDIKFLDANGENASVSKFNIQYKKSDSGYWKELTDATKTEYNGDTNSYEIKIPEAGSYDIRISTIDGVVSKENTIDVVPEWKAVASNNQNNEWYAYTNISTNSIVKVNEPKLADGMIAIKYTEEATGSKWANAMTKDESMWVWIPRFAYKITSGYHQSGDDINPADGTLGAGTIEVAFLDINNNFLNGETGDVKTNIADVTYTGNAQNEWLLAPGFTFGDEEITGFWFAKFEVSNTDGYGADSSTANNVNLTLQIKPNVTSWTYMNSANIFTVCQNLTSTSNYTTYFNNVTNVDTHLTKNVEWGAVAYLAHSKYGLNGQEICINNNSSYITGIGSGSTSASSSSSTTNQYNTTTGITASTTKNVYGIYDMSGGAWEYVAACLTGYTSKLTTNTDTSYINKYIDVYNAYSTGYTSSKYGDAIYETSNTTAYNNSPYSWFKDYSYFVYSGYPVFRRGGDYNHGSSAGLFGFDYYNGNAYNSVSFRPVCVVMN